MMMGKGGIPMDNDQSLKNTYTNGNLNNRMKNEFLEDYSNTNKCCIWSIFGGRRNKTSKKMSDLKNSVVNSEQQSSSMMSQI